MQIWNFLQYKATQDPDAYQNYDSDEGVYRYIIQGFEALKNGSLETPPMNQNFWDWAVRDKLLQAYVTGVGWVYCPNQLCAALGWEGSPDIAGVGVSTMLKMLRPR
jgi:hypothetical protein